MRLFKNDAIAQMQLLYQQGVTVDAIVTEHQAMLESNLQETRNFTGWAQYRALIGG